MNAALLATWDVRQEMLATLLRAHGAENHEFRVDLSLGRFWWLHPETGQPSVVAETKVLGTWARSNGSVLAGWENRSLPPSAVVDPVADVASGVIFESEADAWQWAFAIAEGAGADFVYCAPNAQTWIFLGLWSVRTAAAGEEPFVASPPWPHVLAVLEQLHDYPDPEDPSEVLVRAAESGSSLPPSSGEPSIPADRPSGLELLDDPRAVLLRNYGRTFVHDHVRIGTRWEVPLREIGEGLIALADGPVDERTAGIATLTRKVKGFVQ